MRRACNHDPAATAPNDTCRLRPTSPASTRSFVALAHMGHERALVSKLVDIVVEGEALYACTARLLSSTHTNPSNHTTMPLFLCSSFTAIRLLYNLAHDEHARRHLSEQYTTSPPSSSPRSNPLLTKQYPPNAVDLDIFSVLYSMFRSNDIERVSLVCCIMLQPACNEHSFLMPLANLIPPQGLELIVTMANDAALTQPKHLARAGYQHHPWQPSRANGHTPSPHLAPPQRPAGSHEAAPAKEQGPGTGHGSRSEPVRRVLMAASEPLHY